MAAAPGPIAWSHPIKLFDGQGARMAPASVREVPGVYRIRVLDNTGQPFPMRRLNGDDPHGILHAGKTLYLNYRMRQFQGSAVNQRQDHQAGCNFFYYRYVGVFALDRLYADYVETDSGQAARDLEKELQNRYWSRYLDLPPLDAQA